MRSRALQASALVTLLAVGVLIGRIGDGGSPSAGVEAAALASRITRAEAERDRLRDERDQLEARLAAERAPAVCADDTVSTEEGRLFDAFAVEYPCGWHALYDARPGAAGERPGLSGELLLLSRLPVAMAPGREAGDIQLVDWTDDPVDQIDRLPPIASWVEQERASFTPAPPEERSEIADGTTVYQFAGTQPLPEGGSAAVVVALWEFERAGRRHVLRATTVEPGTRTSAAFDHLIRSFKILP